MSDTSPPRSGVPHSNAPHSNAGETQQARIDLAAIFRMAARLGMHEGVCNHFTVMLDGTTGGRHFLINPKGVHFERITANGLLVIDEHGRTVAGHGRPPTSGYAIHTRVHLNHPSAKVVLHLHAPYSTALTAIRGGRLEMIHQNAARFYGEIAYDDHYNGIADATAEGDRMAAAMHGKRIMFLANHGVVVVGETIARAFDDFYYLERACQVQVLAMQTGRELNVMSDAMAKSTHDQFAQFNVNADLYLEEIKHILDEQEPSYAS
jgi:ribulose-5-phosphate 4-epimerase/fuculose-1-phosphate aldolase